METQGNKIVVSFEDRGGGIRTVDKHDVVGFWLAGEDRQWKVAQAKVVDGQKVEVWSDEVAKPVAVRYAWADNPVCNLFNAEGLPVTPFRTDDWPGITADAK
jgi:sialate O-acetylesterase